MRLRTKTQDLKYQEVKPGGMSAVNETTNILATWRKETIKKKHITKLKTPDNQTITNPVIVWLSGASGLLQVPSMPLVSQGVHSVIARGQASKTLLNKLLLLQKRVLRFIFFVNWRDSAVPLFVKANIPPLNIMYCHVYSNDLFRKNCKLDACF